MIQRNRWVPFWNPHSTKTVDLSGNLLHYFQEQLGCSWWEIRSYQIENVRSKRSQHLRWDKPTCCTMKLYSNWREDPQTRRTLKSLSSTKVSPSNRYLYILTSYQRAISQNPSTKLNSSSSIVEIWWWNCSHQSGYLEIFGGALSHSLRYHRAGWNHLSLDLSHHEFPNSERVWHGMESLQYKKALSCFFLKWLAFIRWLSLTSIHLPTSIWRSFVLLLWKFYLKHRETTKIAIASDTFTSLTMRLLQKVFS